MPQLSIAPTGFLLDGEPHRILSGAIHYFRVHPGHWRDRIHKARLMGLNTVETYVAWDYHAPQRGVFRTDGDRDLGRFLDLISDEGMQAIVRPGPYICAEWSNGGLPVWLTADPEVRLRSSERRYMDAVEEYLAQLAPILVPRQSDRGGPVALMQVENEYGAYGKDKAYLARLVEVYRELGIVVPLSTVDQPVDRMLADGSLADVLITGSFGSRVPERLEILRSHQPDGPLMCSEFWDGWFDSWGGRHHTTAPEEAARSLDQLLAAGASVNIYMFHGGTNFGLTSGANDKGLYQPLVTSYDYDAPLAEDGTPTAKYWALREVIARYADVPEDRPLPRSSAPELTVAFEQSLAWLPDYQDHAAWKQYALPPTFDELRHEGFIAYRREIRTEGAAALVLSDLRDRAQVFLDGEPIGVLLRDHHEQVLALPAGAHGRLDILVEDLGRVDYEKRLGEWKGIGPVSIPGMPDGPWEAAPLDIGADSLARALDERGCAVDHDAPIGGPVLLSGAFSAAGDRDLFLSTAGWGKGIAWINGFNLGRYWSRGPQQTLYVPSPILQRGENRLLVLELGGMVAPEARFVSRPELGPEHI